MEGISGMRIACVSCWNGMLYTTLRDQLTELAGKWTRIEDVFPMQNGDIPASYVSLPEGRY